MTNSGLDILGMKTVTTVISYSHFREQVLVCMHLIEVVLESSQLLYLGLTEDSHRSFDQGVVKNWQNGENQSISIICGDV